MLCGKYSANRPMPPFFYTNVLVGATNIRKDDTVNCAANKRSSDGSSFPSQRFNQAHTQLINVAHCLVEGRNI